MHPSKAPFNDGAFAFFEDHCRLCRCPMRAPIYLAPMITLFRKNLLAALAGLLLFTGCITIEENYTFKKDGSGTMEYVVDMSELGELMKSFGGEGGDMGDMGNMDMSSEIAALKGIQGISKVKLDGKKQWVQRISFAFKDVDALNRALNTLMPDSSGTDFAFFRWEGNTLVRSNNGHARELGKSFGGGGTAEVIEDEEEEVTESVAEEVNEAVEGSEEGEDDGEGMDMSMMLEAMKYKYSFKFANAVSASTTSEGVNKAAPSSKELRIDTDFSYISKTDDALDLRITLDK